LLTISDILLSALLVRVSGPVPYPAGIHC